MPNDQDVAAYIGLDWGDRQHAVQIQAAAPWALPSNSGGAQ